MTKKSTSGAGVRPEFAGCEDYKNVLNTINETNKCPFCPDNFKYHSKPIILEHNNWIATENSWPYKGSEYHFVFIPIEHKTDFEQFSGEDFATLQYLVNFVIKKYNIKGGGICLRFGEQTYTGATVHHLHAHLIVPQLGDDGKATPVYFPIG